MGILDTPGQRVTTRTVTHALAGSGGTASSIAVSGEANYRYLISLPVTPTRYRFRIRNFSPRLNTGGSANLNFGGIWMGSPKVPVYPVYRWDGGMLATGTQVATATTLAGSTEYVSPWVTSPALTAGVPAVMSWAIDNVGGGGSASVWGDTHGGLARVASGAVAGASGASFTSTSGFCAFDVRIEYEYRCAYRPDGRPVTPIVLTIGDSITMGAGPAGIAGSAGGPPFWPHESWPGAAAVRQGFAVVNAGVGGSTTTDWAAATTTSHNHFSRFDLATSLPDVAVIALGTNDCAAGAGYDTQIQNIDTIVANLRAFGIQRFYVATIIPGGFGSPANFGGGATTNGSQDITVTSTNGARAEMAITGTGIPANTIIRAITSATTMNLSQAATATNTGLTFAIGTTGYITSAANESIRNRTNTLIRKNSWNTNGVIDFDTRLADPFNPAIPLGHLVPITPHPSLAGYQAMAAIVPTFR